MNCINTLTPDQIAARFRLLCAAGLAVPFTCDDQAEMRRINVAATNALVQIPVDADKDAHRAAIGEHLRDQEAELLAVQDKAVARLTDADFAALLLKSPSATVHSVQIGGVETKLPDPRPLQRKEIQTWTPRVVQAELAARVPLPFTDDDVRKMRALRAVTDRALAANPNYGDKERETIQYPCDVEMLELKAASVNRLTQDEYVALLQGTPLNCPQLIKAEYRLPGVPGTFTGYETLVDYQLGVASPMFDLKTSRDIMDAMNAQPGIVDEYGAGYYDAECDEFCWPVGDDDCDLLTYAPQFAGHSLDPNAPGLYPIGRYDWENWTRVHEGDATETTEGECE